MIHMLMLYVYSHTLYKIGIDYKRYITPMMIPHKQRRRRKMSREKRVSEKSSSSLCLNPASLKAARDVTVVVKRSS